MRKVIGGLVEKEVLTRRGGAGTFVARKVEKSFSKLSSFSEDSSARGRRASSSWISRAAGTVNPEESMSLGLSPGASVYRFHRIRYADEQPIVLDSTTIAGCSLPGVEAVKVSLYVALEKAGSRPVRALQPSRAVAFGTDHARMLGLDTDRPGLLIERRAFL